MKKILTILLLVTVSLFVVACTTPPSDLPTAQIVDEQETTALDEEPIPVEPDGGIGDGATGEELQGVTSLPIDMQASTFEFEGYGPGKSHVGTFSELSGNLLYENGMIVGGSGTIQLASVDTGIDALNNHLKSDDFFDVETYPEITVEFTNVGETQVTAIINFRGVAKTVSFPAEVTESSIKADFLLDITEFNFKYVGINDQVRIAFEFYPEG